MSTEQFWNSSPREFQNRQIGFYNLEHRREQTQWERIRWQTVFLLNIHIGKNHQLKPHDIAIFPWEKEAEQAPKEIDPAAMERMIAAMDRHQIKTQKPQKANG